MRKLLLILLCAPLYLTAQTEWYQIGQDIDGEATGDFSGYSVSLSSDGNLTYALQHTFNNVLANGFAEEDATVFTHSTITGKTAAFEGTIPTPPIAIRLALTSHTAGSASATIVQVSTA